MKNKYVFILLVISILIVNIGCSLSKDDDLAGLIMGSALIPGPPLENYNP